MTLVQSPAIGIPQTPTVVEDIGDDDRATMTARLLEEISNAAGERERERLRGQVVVLNMPVAGAIASRYRHRGLNIDDLTQVAYVGLVKAVRGFDPGYGKDSLSYAVPTMMGEVKRYFRDFGWIVRPPRRVQELQADFFACSARLSQQLGRPARPSEVADDLNIDLESVIEVLSADGCFTPASLDVMVGEVGSPSLGDMLATDDNDIDRADVRMVLAPAVRRLSDRDRRIIELRFFHGRTQEEIGRDIGISQMQVSRVLSRILADLRHNLERAPSPHSARRSA